MGEGPPSYQRRAFWYWIYTWGKCRFMSVYSYAEFGASYVLVI